VEVVEDVVVLVALPLEPFREADPALEEERVGGALEMPLLEAGVSSAGMWGRGGLALKRKSSRTECTITLHRTKCHSSKRVPTYEWTPRVRLGIRNRWRATRSNSEALAGGVFLPALQNISSKSTMTGSTLRSFCVSSSIRK